LRVKEHSKSLLCRSFSLRACRGFEAARASGPGVQSGVNGVEQRQIAQLGSTAKVALRKDITAHQHDIRWTSRLQARNLMDFAYNWLARKI
jgi:hypothetical protein